MWSWVRVWGLVAAVLVFMLPTPAAHAAPMSLGRLDRAHNVLTFEGGFENPTPLPLVNVPQPVVCEVTCQAFTFVARTRDSFLVSVKDKAGSQNNGWDLYLYDAGGALVGSAIGIGANGQAIAVRSPQRGRYTIVVTFTYAYDATAAYFGEVRLMRGPSWQPAAADCRVPGAPGCFDLPVLLAEPASAFHVDGIPPAASTPLGFPFPVEIPTGSSCYVDETVQLGATRCLRFTSNVKNVGGGLLDLRLTYNGAECHAVQVLHGNRHRNVTRPSGPCEFHAAHAHFHYKDFVGFSLHRLGADGSIGAQVGNGLKESFCLADDDYFGFGTAGPNGPRNYAGQPGCSLPASVDPTGAVLEEGLTPGWGDVYTWDTPGQVIDITTVPPGRYVLVEKTNPSGTMVVHGPAQTCSATEITLTDSAVTETGTRPVIACPAQTSAP